MKSRTKFFIATLSLLFAGCGGGTEILNGFPDIPANVNLPNGPGINGGTLTRTILAGDTWEYGISGVMLREIFDYEGKKETTLQGPVTGRMVRTVTRTNLLGLPTFKITDSLSYSINGGLTTVENVENYVRQMGDGTIVLVGRRDQFTDAVGPNGINWVPGTWGPGASVGGQERQDHTTAYPLSFFEVSTSMNATNLDTVQTNSTPFTAWRTVYADGMHKEWDIRERIVNGQSTPAGFIFRSDENVQSLDWWAPIIGAPVRREYKSTRKDSVVNTASIVNGVLTVEYHTENRTLDLVMVLKTRSLN